MSSTFSGQQIGNLVLREKIGEGGMGSIWSAEHVTLGREVAVKFLALDCDEDHAAAQRFTLEARTIARISSPYVPQVFDHGTLADGTPYIVMELIDGVSLKTWVAQHGAMSLKQAARLAEQVGMALAAAHELGVIHRDIKPENILVSGGENDFHVRVIDFGIAKTTALSGAPRLTAIGTTLGTPSYMSPEQMMSAKDVDERSDLWSLAVVIYWVLTRCLPFEGENFAAVCVAVTLSRFQPVTELSDELPEEIDAWFDKAFCPEPEGRFESAEAMTQALRALAGPASVRHPHVNVSSATPPASVVSRTATTAPPPSRVLTLADSSVGGLAQTGGTLVVPTLARQHGRAFYGAIGMAMGLLSVATAAFLHGPIALPSFANRAPATMMVAPTAAAVAASGEDDDSANALPHVVDGVVEAPPPSGATTDQVDASPRVHAPSEVEPKPEPRPTNVPAAAAAKTAANAVTLADAGLKAPLVVAERGD
jgi:serine/threonine-protein kinase